MDEKISFLPAACILSDIKNGKQKWIHLYAMSHNPEEAEYAKEQIKKGEEARELLLRMEVYYKKTIKEDSNG